MSEKTWIIRDADGNLPTADEADDLRKMFCRDAYAPQLKCKEQYDADGNTTLCEWQFSPGATGGSMFDLAQEKEALRQMNNRHVSILELVKLAVGARDMRTAKKLLGLGEDD